MKFIFPLLGMRGKSTKDKIRETRSIIHDDKNRFVKEMIQHEKRLDHFVKEAVINHRNFRNSVAYKMAIMTGATKRGL